MRKILVIILGVLLMIAGFTLIARPVEAFSMLGYIMGAALLVNGVANIIIWFRLRKVSKISVWYLVSAIISVIFALAICGDIKFKITAEIVFLYMAAAWFFITGIMRIVMAFNLKKEGVSNWWLMLILGILLIMCGAMSMANPIILMLAIGLNLGINMLFCGIDLITIATVIE